MTAGRRPQGEANARPYDATAGYHGAPAAGARATPRRGQTVRAATRVPVAARPLRRPPRPHACAGAAPAGAARRRRRPSRRRRQRRRWAPHRQRRLLPPQDRLSRQGRRPRHCPPRPLRSARPPARPGCRARRRPARAAPQRPPPPAACTAAQCLRAGARTSDKQPRPAQRTNRLLGLSAADTALVHAPQMASARTGSCASPAPSQRLLSRR